MSQVTKSITVDTSEKNLFLAIVAKQCDTGSRFLRITICSERTKIKVPASAKALINAERADGESAAFMCTVNDDGTVTAPLTGWMLAKCDTVRCSISILGENGERLTTTTFFIAVEAAEYSDTDITDEEDFSILRQLIDECADAKSGCETAAKNANTARAGADSAASAASTAAGSANTAASAASSAASAANTAKTNADSAAAAANSAASKASTSADAAESAAEACRNIAAGINSMSDEITGKVYAIGVNAGLVYLEEV